MRMEGAVAIVTGGSSGLGRATALRLVGKGAKVAVLDISDRDGPGGAASDDIAFLRTDVTDEASVKDALNAVEERFGEARILVNCAGVAPPAKAVDRDGEPLPLSAFARVVNVNLLGTFNVVSKFAARLQRAEPLEGGERGVVVNTASVAAFEGQIGQAAYSASKAGVAALGLPLAREFARHGIRVMTIAPGIFMTPMLASLPEEAQASLGAQVPFPSRLGDPDEYARLVEAIIDNPMLNGETIRIDGAIRMAPR